jgi:hypothetical protein
MIDLSESYQMFLSCCITHWDQLYSDKPVFNFVESDINVTLYNMNKCLSVSQSLYMYETCIIL